MAPIAIEQVTKIYPDGFRAIESLDLSVADGEFMVLVGPSGCGKTTALRMIAGLEEITDGIVRIGDRVVNDVQAKDRDVAMVFQNYALYPHMTVAENIGFALTQRKMAKDEIARRVRDAATILGLGGYLERKPGQLSGGQRQRVAMGRAIVREPRAFLMDEPLSNLDAKLRVQMRAEVTRIQRRVGVATLYVTHDQVEAMTMGDRVAVLRDGVLQQCDEPQSLYDAPANMFVAAFMGSPPMNLFEARLGDDATGVFLGSQRLDLGDLPDTRPGLRRYTNRRITLGVRAEDLTLDAEGPLSAQVDLVEALGSDLLVHFTTDATSVEVDAVLDEDAELGEPILVGESHVARLAPRARVRPGDRVRFSAEADRLHFFDATSGAAITA